MAAERCLVLLHEECEGAGVFESLLLEKGLEIHHVELYKGDMVPERLGPGEALLIMGGPMNVYEEEGYPFLRDEDRLIKKALKTGAPVLGICLGAQLIAKAAGARVWKGQVKEIGWYEVRLTEEGRKDPLFKGFPRQFPIFQWHGDSFDLPSAAVPLAENELYLQAFRLGNAYALQFHLEVTEEMIRVWLSEYDEEVRSLRGFIDPEQILKETENNINTLNRLAKLFIERWLKDIRGEAQSI